MGDWGKGGERQAGTLFIFTYLGVIWAFLAQAEVEWIAEVSFIVCAKVEDDGQSLARIDAGSANIKLKLSDGNADAVHTQVAQAEDTGAV